jgi:hypothetical protein
MGNDDGDGSDDRNGGQRQWRSVMLQAGNQDKTGERDRRMRITEDAKGEGGDKKDGK